MEDNSVIELIDNEVYRIEMQIRTQKPLEAIINEQQLNKVKEIVNFLATIKYAGEHDDMTIECGNCDHFCGAAVIGIRTPTFDLVQEIEMAAFAKLISEQSEIFSVEPIDEDSIGLEFQVSNIYE